MSKVVRNFIHRNIIHDLVGYVQHTVLCKISNGPCKVCRRTGVNELARFPQRLKQPEANWWPCYHKPKSYELISLYLISQHFVVYYFRTLHCNNLLWIIAGNYFELLFNFIFWAQHTNSSIKPEKIKCTNLSHLYWLNLDMNQRLLLIKINRYGFFGANTDISVIHGPIADISKNFKSCFLLHYQKYNVFYALPFYQKLQKSGFVSKNFSKCSNFNILLWFLINLINDDVFFGSDSQCVLHGWSCLLVYENTPASVVAR